MPSASSSSVSKRANLEALPARAAVGRQAQAAACLVDAPMSCAKAAKRIDDLFGRAVTDPELIDRRRLDSRVLKPPC